MISIDFKSLHQKESNRENNPETFFTMEVNKHKTCGFSFLFKFRHDES